jgi:hypothetical protein
VFTFERLFDIVSMLACWLIMPLAADQRLLTISLTSGGALGAA